MGEAAIIAGLYDTETVGQRLEEALATMRRLRSTPHTWPRGYGCYWPDMLTGFWEMWNALDDAEKAERTRELNQTRIHPTPQQISRMDEVLPDWVLYVKDPRNRKVIMAIASGASLRGASRFDGRSHEWIRQIYQQGLGDICRGLNGT